MLISEKINHAFNKQIGHELGNSIQYLAIATHFERESLFGLAKIYYTQADEEREHAMKFVKFLLDAGGKVVIPAIPRTQSEFDSALAAAQLALDAEMATTRQIYDLVALATEREELHRRELPPVVRQRAARGSFQRRGAAHGDPPGRPQRPHGRGVPGSRTVRLDAAGKIEAGEEDDR